MTIEEVLSTRWFFDKELTRNERKVYDKVLKLADISWDYFIIYQLEISEALANENLARVNEVMEKSFKSLLDYMDWEIINTSKGKYQLILKPKYSRPMVDVIISLAPEQIGWKFCTYTPPLGFDSVCNYFEKESGGISLNDFGFLYAVNDQNMIDISTYYTANNVKALVCTDELQYLVKLAIKKILGEEMYEKWIGKIELNIIPENKLLIKPISIAQLEIVFSNVLSEIQFGLPKQPYYLLKEHIGIEKQLISDKNALFFNDVLSASTCNEKLLKAVISEQVFASERFSNFNETFCYIKLGGVVQKRENEVWLQILIGRVNDALVENQQGRVIGYSFGFENSYIILAIMNLDVSIIKNTLKEVGAPTETWMHFFDKELNSEWVGVYDDTPLP